MKVTGPSGPSPSVSARPTASGGGFSLQQTASAGPTSAAQAAPAASSLANVSALMALQGVESATERRRRAVRRGGGLLDRLDALKLTLLSGEGDDAEIERLARGLREERPQDDDAALNGLLDQIDLRAAVELAKAEVRRSAA